MHRKEVYLPIKLIEQATAEGWLRSLGYFVRLKAVHGKPVFYRASLRKVAESIKCSPVALSTHLKVLEQHGLIVRGKHWACLGTKQLQKKFGGKLMHVHADNKFQFDYLRSLSIRFSLSRQAYRIRKGNPHYAHKIQTPRKNIVSLNSPVNYTGLSCKGVGKLFGLTAASGSRLRKRLERLKVIKTKKMFFVVSRQIDLRGFLELRNQFMVKPYCIFKDGQILQPLYTQIEWAYKGGTPKKHKSIAKNKQA